MGGGVAISASLYGMVQVASSGEQSFALESLKGSETPLLGFRHQSWVDVVEPAPDAVDTDRRQPQLTSTCPFTPHLYCKPPLAVQ